MEILPGPGVPDRGFGYEIRYPQTYETGKGSIVLRSRTEIEVTKEWP